MNSLSLQHLARLLQAEQRGPSSASTAPLCTGFSTDSRSLQRGECFIALRGKQLDGHLFVNQAFARGASAALVDHQFPIEEGTDCRILRVRDTTLALGTLARNLRETADFRVVAVTGSVGKTSTRRMIAHVLGTRFRVHQSPKNFNNQIGLPLTLLGAGTNEEVVVVELGSNAPGEIAYLTHIAQPDVAVVTNVSPAHLEGFGDMDTVLAEKLSIAQGLRPEGRLVVNGDDPAILSHCRTHRQSVTTFGMSSVAEIRAERIELGADHSRFWIGDQSARLPLPGRGSIANALAAWAVCSTFDITWPLFAQALNTLTPTPMRGEVLKLGNLTLINDCYNASPASMTNALDILRAQALAPQGRRICIFGDMAELGTESHALHQTVGRFIAQAEVDLLIAVGPQAKITAQTAQTFHTNELRIECFEDTITACHHLRRLIRDRDVVLVKGSRSMGLERAVESLREMADTV